MTFFKGPNHTHSGDGQDKLMDFAKDTFPLAVYGLQDVFSGRILFLKLWTSNSDPRLIGKWYLQHIYNSQGIIKTSYIFIIIYKFNQQMFEIILNQYILNYIINRNFFGGK